ncbi:hypothetical protein C1H46_021303 [Malus baccata]|uniref:Uncharacterized protein n=1 Tax=Malus baccata TaxID=106549 RepID=A0A540M337_MALBA|nr:hypothetical protein C1H46_021303 [Malus baccata]
MRGRSPGLARKQALDISEADDYPSQSGYRYHQFVAAERRQPGMISTASSKFQSHFVVPIKFVSLKLRFASAIESCSSICWYAFVDANLMQEISPGNVHFAVLIS